MLFDGLDEASEELFDDIDSSNLMAVSVEINEIQEPKSTENLIGHDDVEQQLVSMINSNRIPHGLIFSGLEGVGKSVMAFRLARYLLSGKEKQEDAFSIFGDNPKEDSSLYISQNDSAFSRVASGGHPDLRVIGRPYDDDKGRFKSSVVVDDIRKIAPFMRQTASTDDGWRIVIINDADTMTRSSQNSLLKILEEPPEKALLILIAHRAGALLPTIYSRCVHIPFSPLSDTDIRKALAGRVAEDKIPLILAMAEGSLGAAYEYSDDKNIDLISQSIGFLNGGKKLSWYKIQQFAEFVGNKGNDDSQRIFRETLLWVSGGLLRGKKAECLNGFESLLMSRKLKIYDDLRSHFDRCLLGNLDKRFLIMGAYMAFEG